LTPQLTTTPVGAVVERQSSIVRVLLLAAPTLQLTATKHIGKRLKPPLRVP
jgi:hypothetical protein